LRGEEALEGVVLWEKFSADVCGSIWVVEIRKGMKSTTKSAMERPREIGFLMMRLNGKMSSKRRT